MPQSCLLRIQLESEMHSLSGGGNHQDWNRTAGKKRLEQWLVIIQDQESFTFPQQSAGSKDLQEGSPGGYHLRDGQTRPGPKAMRFFYKGQVANVSGFASHVSLTPPSTPKIDTDNS